MQIAFKTNTTPIAGKTHAVLSAEVDLISTSLASRCHRMQNGMLRRGQSDTVRQLIYEKAGQLDLVDRFIEIMPLDDLESLVRERR